MTPAGHRKLLREMQAQQRIKQRMAAWWHVNFSPEYLAKKAMFEAMEAQARSHLDQQIRKLSPTH